MTNEKVTIPADSGIFQKALSVIRQSGAKFRIIMPTGEQFGDLPVVTEPERKKRKLRHPYGALKAYYLPYLKDLEPGGYVEVPWGAFLGGPLSSAISAHGCHEWGNGQVVVSVNKTKKVVEVMRGDKPNAQCEMKGL